MEKKKRGFRVPHTYVIIFIVIPDIIISPDVISIPKHIVSAAILI